MIYVWKAFLLEPQHDTQKKAQTKLELRKTGHLRSENCYKNDHPSRISMEKEMQMPFGQPRGRTISYANNLCAPNPMIKIRLLWIQYYKCRNLSMKCYSTHFCSTRRNSSSISVFAKSDCTNLLTRGPCGHRVTVPTC